MCGGGSTGHSIVAFPRARCPDPYNNNTIIRRVRTSGQVRQMNALQCAADREVALKLVEQDGWALMRASVELREAVKQYDLTRVHVGADYYVLLKKTPLLPPHQEVDAHEAVIQILMHAPTLLPVGECHSRKLILEAVKQNGLALWYACLDLCCDREVVLAAVKQNGLALEYAGYCLCTDRETVLVAVKQNGLALEYVGNRSLCADREVVLAAVKQNGLALEYVDCCLLTDREIVLAAVKQNGMALKYSEIGLDVDTIDYDDRDEVVLEINDYELVLEAVKQNGLALKYADRGLLTDRELVLEAVKQDGMALKYVVKGVVGPADDYDHPVDLRTDREVVFEAISQNRLALQFVVDKLHDDKDFCCEAENSKIARSGSRAVVCTAGTAVVVTTTAAEEDSLPLPSSSPPSPSIVILCEVLVGMGGSRVYVKMGHESTVGDLARQISHVAAENERIHLILLGRNNNEPMSPLSGLEPLVIT